MIYNDFFRWLGEDLSVYDDDQDLREVDIPVIKNMVKGYAASVIGLFYLPLNDRAYISLWQALFRRETSLE
jgi:hypothetical protein